MAQLAGVHPQIQKEGGGGEAIGGIRPIPHEETLTHTSFSSYHHHLTSAKLHIVFPCLILALPPLLEEGNPTLALLRLPSRRDPL